MANVSLRRAVTTIVSAANTSAMTVNQEVVPDRYTTVTADMCSTPQGIASAINQSQRDVHDVTKSARSLPHLGGMYVPDLVLPAFTPTRVQTRIGGSVSWYVSAVRPTNGMVGIANVQASSVGNHVQVVTKTTHSLKAGDTVVVNGVNGCPVNQAWQILQAIDDTDVTLAGSSFSGSYQSGGNLMCPGWDVYEGAQDDTNGILTLIATVPLTCDLHCFPKPSAVRS